MKYLEKIWVRGLISFFLGGVIPEWIFMSTGDPNRPRDNSLALVSIALIVLIYFGLTSWVKKQKKPL
jgi:hypothetical protein